MACKRSSGNRQISPVSSCCSSAGTEPAAEVVDGTLNTSSELIGLLSVTKSKSPTEDSDDDEDDDEEEEDKLSFRIEVKRVEVLRFI